MRDKDNNYSTEREKSVQGESWEGWEGRREAGTMRQGEREERNRELRREGLGAKERGAGCSRESVCVTEGGNGREVKGWGRGEGEGEGRRRKGRTGKGEGGQAKEREDRQRRGRTCEREMTLEK